MTKSMIAGAVLVGLGWVGAASADTLETTDGRTLTVRVIVQSDTHTMVEIYNEDGTKRRQTFPADQIKSITPDLLPDADQIEEFKEHIARVRARVANANKR